MFKALDSLVIVVNLFSILGMVLILRSVARCQKRQKTMLNSHSSKIEVFQVYMATIFYLAAIIGSALLTTFYVLSV